MKIIRVLLLSFLTLVSGVGVASAIDEGNRQTLVGYLTLADGWPQRLVVNPVNRGRLTLNVQNPRTLSRLMKRKEYAGLVRVEVRVLRQDQETVDVRVLKIQPVKARRVPLENWVAAADGNG